MAFSANPDGIAVIADTRITFSNSFQDGFQKIFFPTQNSFVAVAGSVGILKFVMNDLSKFLQQKTPNARLDAFRERLRARSGEIVRTGELHGAEEGASFIYGDVKLERGPTRCRLMRFDLTFSDVGKPLIKEQTGASFSAEEAKKFPEDQRANELPWLCNGLIEGTRNFLGNTAMEHVRQYLAGGLEISSVVDVEAIKARRSVYQEVNVRGRSKPFRGNAAVVLSMGGPSDGSFRKKLREFANEQEMGCVPAAVDVIQILGMAALKRIEFLMTEIPGFIGSETVSDTWSLATISRRGGQQLVTGDDPIGVTLPFGLRSELG